MGTASTEGFGPALLGVNVEDAGDDEDVGSNNDQHWNKDIQCNKK